MERHIDAVGFFFTESAWIVKKPVESAIETPSPVDVAHPVFQHTTHDGVEFSLSVDGFVAARINKTIAEGTQARFEAVANLAKYLNCWVTLVHVAFYQSSQRGLQKVFLTPNDLFRVHEIPEELQASMRSSEQWRRHVASGDSNNMERFRQWEHSRPGLDMRVGRRASVIDESMLSRSFEAFDEVLSREEEGLLDLLNEYLRAVWRYEQHDNSGALIAAWTASERLLCTLWQEYIDGKRAAPSDENATVRINRTRRDRLLGNDYTASICTEVLELAGEISLEIYELLNAARKARNAWVHDMKPCSSEQAGDSIKCFEAMLDRVKGLDLAMGFGQGLSV